MGRITTNVTPELCLIYRACHVPPHVYLNAVRIAQAQALIRLGTPLAAVALECGFADQSHLTRRFKGSVGATPSAWQRMRGNP
nr:AraC family transcriptional regulator [Massilia sp. JS1662]